MTIVELDEKAARSALAITGLDVALAGVRDDEMACYAAHAATHSIVVLHYDPNNVTVWKIVGGTEEERRAQFENVKAKLIAATKKKKK